MMRCAWYGRLSTKDKQDPTLSFPSQRKACERKASELGGELVCDFTDQETGRRDDRRAWSELLAEARDRDTRRFDAVVIYHTSRLSRELFHALAYERELSRAGVQIYYAIAAGDQTSPEGRLMRHMFQALDQFEVEKLSREVRRGQSENARQGYRNGGRAPYGYQLKHLPHPDPRRAKAGDHKSMLEPNPQEAPVVTEIGERFLSGWSYTKIANHLNGPGGPDSPKNPDSKRNTAGKWAKTTIRCILQNPVYTGRLYWNRLDYRQLKTGDGPLVKRPEEEWIEAAERHEAIISDETFQRIAEELDTRRRTEGSRRRMPQSRAYPLRGILHCATGHNPLRMHGKERNGTIYYACCYRIAYGDKAAEAVGHGKWQYVREDQVMPEIDRFFANNIFGSSRIEHLGAQYETVTQSLATQDTSERDTLRKRIADVERRMQLQVEAIEAGVEPALINARIQQLKHERLDLQRALATSERSTVEHPQTGLETGCEILDQLPVLDDELARADPELRRKVFDAFQLAVEIDRNKPQLRLKALVSSAFRGADLDDLVANECMAGDPVDAANQARADTRGLLRGE
jgi:site-specific DNA recombinase